MTTDVILEEAVHAYFDDRHATLWGRAFDLSQSREAAEEFATAFVSEVLELMEER